MGRAGSRPGVLAVVALLLATSCQRPSPEEVQRWRDFVGVIEPVSIERLGLSWRPGCPVGPSELRLVRLSFWGMDDRAHEGELVVHRRIADRMVAVFRVLWMAKFPIARMETADRSALPEHFDSRGEYLLGEPATDTINDTYGFFCRRVTGSTAWSQHSYGLAVDINPVQNPYQRGAITIPAAGRYDRSAPGTVTPDGIVVAAMCSQGMKWGGNWRTAKDFMHFSLNGR